MKDVLPSPHRPPRPRRRAPIRLLLPLLALAPAAAAPAEDAPATPAADLTADFERRTTVHVLDNGWTFILVERPVAPVFSFATFAGVGGAQEVPGITGLAHMFEHMAFKGTPTIGTTDYEKEKEALAAVEAAYQAYQAERLAPEPDPDEVERLLAEFRARQKEAARFVVKNEFVEIVERQGGTGINASTGPDYTNYYYSLPANKVELFAYLESERFLHPVFREFYAERDVVQEERRLGIESQPIGRLVEQFIATAFTAHPYGQSTIGFMSDLKAITATDAREFFEVYYRPSNLVTAVVGDFDAEALVPMLEKYFGRIPAGPPPPPLRTVEPPQIAEKVVVLKDPSQPFYLEGYHKPAATHPDEAVYRAIDDVLSNGRTSRLYRSLVRDRRIAVATQSFSTIPGGKYPNLWAVYAVPARGVASEEVQAAIREELTRLASEEVTDAELARFRTRARADLIRSLGNNTGLAEQLALYHLQHGEWRELFRSLDRQQAVTRADVLRVARQTFREENRTVAMIVTAPPAQSREPAQPPEPAPPAQGEEGEEAGR